ARAAQAQVHPGVAHLQALLAAAAVRHIGPDHAQVRALHVSRRILQSLNDYAPLPIQRQAPSTAGAAPGSISPPTETKVRATKVCARYAVKSRCGYSRIDSAEFTTPKMHKETRYRVTVTSGLRL